MGAQFAWEAMHDLTDRAVDLAEVAEIQKTLRETPGVAGVHDVHAAAIGVGAFEFGDVSLIFGTWSINQVFANTPKPDSRWHTHASIEKNRWLHMCTSPASASNANWFWELFGISELEELEKALKNAEKSLLSEDRAFFMPYLFGGPAGTTPGASLISARGWHTQSDINASVIEGIVFNHKHHFDMLSEKVDTSGRIIATGGSMQSDIWAQLVADVFNRDIEISDADESGARGLAILAGVSQGIYSSIEDGISHAGIASTLSEQLREANLEIAVHSLGVPMKFIEHSKRAEILNDLGLTVQNVTRSLVTWNAKSGATTPAAMQLQADENARRKPNR